MSDAIYMCVEVPWRRVLRRPPLWSVPCGIKGPPMFWRVGSRTKRYGQANNKLLNFFPWNSIDKATYLADWMAEHRCRGTCLIFPISSITPRFIGKKKVSALWFGVQ